MTEKITTSSVGRETVVLECNGQQFDRIVQMLEAEIERPIGVGDGHKVHGVIISNTDASKPGVSRGSFKDRVALLGCSLVGLALLFVFVIGILAITGVAADWWRQSPEPHDAKDSRASSWVTADPGAASL
jgi:hypothetical protein